MSFLYLVCNFHSLSSTSSPYLTSSDCGTIIAACAFFGNHRGALVKAEPQKSAPRADLWTGSKWNHHRIPPSARPKCVCGCVWKSVSIRLPTDLPSISSRTGPGTVIIAGKGGRGGEGRVSSAYWSTHLCPRSKFKIEHFTLFIGQKSQRAP